MATANFPVCLPIILAQEGGLSLVRADPGNWTGGKVGVGALKGTNFGIAAASHPGVDIKSLTKDSVAPIYERDYWTRGGCEGLPAGLDLSHFDATVNSGPNSSKKWLAKAKGPAVSDRIHAYAEARMSFLKALRTWVTFGKGWERRVADIEARSVRMALGSATAATDIIKAKAATLAKSAGAASAAATTGTVAAAGAGTAAATTSHPTVDAIVGIIGLMVATYAGFIRWRDGARASAMAHVAAS